MRQPVRFFAIGLLVSATLLFIFYTLFDDDNGKTSEAEPQTISIEEMIENVENDGYRVMTEEQYIALTLASEQTPEDVDEGAKDESAKDEDIIEEDENDAQDKENEEITKHETITHTFTTSENVVSQEIADILLEHKIIDDRTAFLNYLQDNDYMRYIQIGTFTVNSDMTFEELAKVLTTYPGN